MGHTLSGPRLFVAINDEVICYADHQHASEQDFLILFVWAFDLLAGASWILIIH